MFKSITFSKVFKHEPNRGKGKGYHGKMMMAVERMWLVRDEAICSPDFSPIRKYSKFMVWRKSGSVCKTQLSDDPASKRAVVEVCRRLSNETKSAGGLNGRASFHTTGFSGHLSFAPRAGGSPAPTLAA